jgi:hypothetical protein
MAVEGISAPEQSVLTVLAIMSNDDAQCWPGINGAAGITGKTKLSERTVQRSLQGLKDAGHINWVDKPGRGRVYVVHPRHSGTPEEVAPATVAPRQPDTRQSGTPVTVTPTPATVAPKQPITTITSTEATPPSRSRARASASPSTRMPVDWKPERFAQDTVARAVIDRRGVDWARAALESFRAWAANAEDRDGRGRKRDWQQAWAQWVIRQDKDDGQRNGRSAERMAGNGRGGSVTGLGPTIDAGARFLARRAASG